MSSTLYTSGINIKFEICEDILSGQEQKCSGKLFLSVDITSLRRVFCYVDYEIKLNCRPKCVMSALLSFHSLVY